MGDFPRAGAPRDALAPGLRTIFHGRYAIYYTASDTGAVIVRVLHGARDIAAVEQAGGFSEVEAKKE